MPEIETDPLVGRAHPRSITRRSYAQTLVLVAAAVLLRYLLDRWMGAALPLVTLFGAVAGAVWLGGIGPAIFAAVAGYLVCNYLFIEPRLHLAVGHFGDLIGLLAYLFTCSLIITFGEARRRAHARAGNRSELLRVTLQSIGDAIITTNVDGRVADMNKVAESLTGWTLADALRQPLDHVFRIVNGVTGEPVENPETKARRERRVIGLAHDTVLIGKDGAERAIDNSAAPIVNGRGHVSGCVLVFRDVTISRRTEQENARQLLDARLLASIIESSDDAIISKSLDGIIQSWNAAAERLFGYTAEQAVGCHISLIIPPERLAEEDQIIARLKAGRRVDHFETERVRSDGGRLLVSLTISPIKDDSGNVVGASKIARDMSRQRWAEADREKFVTLVENSTDFIAMYDLDGVPSFVNRAGLQMVGLDDLEQARATPLQSFFFPEDQHRMMREFLPSVAVRGHGEIDVRFRHFKTGEARWMAYKVVTVPDASGRAIGFATVSQDVTERRRLTDHLHKLASDLSEADRRKNEFLAMLAHELRNPLNPIRNTVRVLRRGGIDGEALGTAAGMLERQVGQLSRLVDDLLDMSRISRGSIELRKARVELAPIIQQAVEAVRAQYRSMNHELTISMPSQALFLDADAARLAQVVGNLLNNAGKFTDRGGRVWLSVGEEDGQAVIRVRDSGIGIAAEDQARLFDMFEQVDTSLERSRDGLGIGLTLVKSLAEMHGGRVDVSSGGLGRGSEFVVRLPLAVEAPKPMPSPAIQEPHTAAPRRVLIVDDNEDGAEALAMLLELAGHETHKAYDGFEAIDAAKRLSPDAVLLDIGLPGLNGYEVCRRIRSEPWGRDLVLVALTGWSQEEDRQQSREAGFDAHLVKPVDPDALIEFLAALPSIGNAEVS